LILKYRCLVPSIVILNPLLDLGRCFIGYPYTQMVEMQNSSDLPAKYRLIPCIDDGLESLSYSSSQSQVTTARSLPIILRKIHGLVVLTDQLFHSRKY